MDCRFNMGLPMLEDGNYKIYDAVAIMVHLAKKHKMESLIGLTPQHRGRINEVLFKFSLQRKRIMLTILEGLQIVNKEEDQQSKVDTFLLKLLSDCKFVDFCVKAISKTKTFIFDKLSLVDFIFFELTFYLLGFFRPFLTEMSPLYCLIDYKSQF